jgi:hypothetical protein
MFLLFGAAGQVHAGLNANSITSNSITSNSITSNSITSNHLRLNGPLPAGSAVDELNGITVENVTLPAETSP